jgi:hypothetical protein
MTASTLFGVMPTGLLYNIALRCSEHKRQWQLLVPFRQSSDKDLEQNSKNTQNGCDISILTKHVNSK